MKIISPFILGVVLSLTLSELCLATGGVPPTSRRENVGPQSDYFNVARMIGRIVLEVPDEGGLTTLEVCTGFAIAEQYITTARHCFFDQGGGQVAHTAAYLIMETTAASSKIYKLKPGFSNESEPHDFVVMQTERVVEEFSPDLLKTSDVAVGNSRDMFILHHPGPGSIVLTRMECRAANPAVVNSELRHICDTDPGSSGAPLFDSRFNLVGMHLSGGRLPGDAQSYNKGIVVTTMIEESQLLKTAVLAATGQANAQPIPPADIEYKADIGFHFLKRGGGWFFRDIDEDESAATQLIEQGSPNSEWTFWGVKRDLIFRWPKIGGSLRTKSPKVNGATFQPIGPISRIRP